MLEQVSEPFVDIPTEEEFQAKTIHDFPFNEGSFGGIGRKCPHMALINVTPDGNCIHSCRYCYSRDHRSNKIFEKVGKIIVYRDLPERLDLELSRLALAPPFYLCPVTDPFMPVKKVVDLTLSVSEVLIKHGVSFHYVTKSKLVERSLNLVSGYPYFFLQMTVETIDPHKQGVLSPRASSVEERIDTLQKFSSEGIFTGMRIDSVIWGFTNEWDSLHELVKIARDVGVKHIVCSTCRLGPNTKRSVPEALEKAGYEKEAEIVRRSYTEFKGGFWFLPVEERIRFHLRMRKLVESFGLTYSVCGELGKEYDSNGITHCEAAPNSFMMKKVNGKFQPVCQGDCLRSCPNSSNPTCGQPLLLGEYPYKMKTLKIS